MESEGEKEQGETERWRERMNERQRERGKEGLITSLKTLGHFILFIESILGRKGLK